MLGSLFSTYLDHSFTDAGQGISVRVVERPGLWLGDEELRELTEKLRQIVRESIPGESLEYGVLTGTREAMSRAVITLISDSKTKEPLAFNALAYMPCNLRGRHVDVLHLGLVVVSPKRREGGFSWILYGLTSILLFLRARLRPMWVSNVTQVPAIIGKVTESFRDVHPTPHHGEEPRIDHLMLARQIMRNHRHVFGVGPDATFDEQKFVIQSSYTGGSDHLKKKFTDAQAHRSEIYNNFCRDGLNYERGDDYLQLGRMDMKVAQDYLLRSVPKKSLVGLAGGLFVIALQGAFLPALHWFETRKYQGEIRPWK